MASAASPAVPAAKAASTPKGGPLSGMTMLLGGMALALSNFIVVLDITIANVSVPHIAGSLAISPTQGTWVITSYSVADAISVPLTGWLAQRFGTVRWFVISIIGFGFFSLMCGLSRSLEMLVAFRILQGLSGGPMMPLSQALLLSAFPTRLRAASMGLWAMTTVSAPIFGPILGGWISDNWSWPWIFFINLPIVAFCATVAIRVLPQLETPTTKARIDYVGLILLIVWVGAFQLMLDTGRENDWFSSPFVVAMAVIAAIGFPAFIIWELGEKNPVVHLQVFRHRGFAIAVLAISLGFGAFFASVVLAPLWMQSVIGYAATDAGYVMAFQGVLAVIISPIAAQLISKFDVRLMVFFGLSWMAFTTLLRSHWSTDADFWTLALPQFLQGAGMPFFFIGLTTLALSSVDPKETTSAAGIMSFLRTLSGAVGTAAATTLWDQTSHVSRSELVSSLNNSGTTVATLQQAGFSAERARGVIDRLVEAQAGTIGANHVYLYAMVVFIIAAAAMWLAPKPKRAAESGSGH